MSQPKFGLVVTKDRVSQMMKSVQDLTKASLLVGIPAEAATREPDETDPHPEITNSEIGYINEFGEPALNIPARPHLVPGVESGLPDAINYFRQGAVAALQGKDNVLQKTFTAAGFSLVSAIQTYMTTADFVPLSPVTIAIRKAEGFKGEKPLIRSGQYRRSMTFVIRKAS